LLRQSLELTQKLGDRRTSAYTLAVLGRLAHARGDVELGLDLHLKALGLFRSIGDKRGVAAGLEGIVGVLARFEPRRALRLAGAAARIREETNTVMTPA